MSLAYLRKISGKAQANLSPISSKSQVKCQANQGLTHTSFRHILGINQVYLRQISGKSQVNLRHISGKFQALIRHISGKFIFRVCIEKNSGGSQDLQGILLKTHRTMVLVRLMLWQKMQGYFLTNLAQILLMFFILSLFMFSEVTVSLEVTYTLSQIFVFCQFQHSHITA